MYLSSFSANLNSITAKFKLLREGLIKIIKGKGLKITNKTLSTLNKIRGDMSKFNIEISMEKIEDLSYEVKSLNQ